MNGCARGLAAALLSVAAVAGCAGASSTEGPAQLESFSLEAPPRVAPLPDARFARTMFESARLEDSAAVIDQCEGPVAIPLGGQRPILVAEHDYCGGSDWISRLDDGDYVELRGQGVPDATYRVVKLKYGIRGAAKVRDLPATDVVLQTCVSKTSLVMVGLDKVEPQLLT